MEIVLDMVLVGGIGGGSKGGGTPPFAYAITQRSCVMASRFYHNHYGVSSSNAAGDCRE